MPEIEVIRSPEMCKIVTMTPFPFSILNTLVASLTLVNFGLVSGLEFYYIAAIGFTGCGKTPHTFCHSDRSEESLFLFMGLNLGEIPRSGQNDKIIFIFRSLFSLKQDQPEMFTSFGNQPGNYTIILPNASI